MACGCRGKSKSPVRTVVPNNANRNTARLRQAEASIRQAAANTVNIQSNSKSTNAINEERKKRIQELIKKRN